MIVIESDLGFLAEANSEVIVHRLIVQKIFLNHVSAISKTQYEVPKTVMRVGFHDVPQNRAASDVNKRLWAKFSFLSHTCAQSAAQDDHFHVGIILRSSENHATGTPVANSSVNIAVCLCLDEKLRFVDQLHRLLNRYSWTSPSLIEFSDLNVAIG